MKVTLEKRILLTVLWKTVTVKTKKDAAEVKKLEKEGWKIVALIDDR